MKKLLTHITLALSLGIIYQVSASQHTPLAKEIAEAFSPSQEPEVKETDPCGIEYLRIKKLFQENNYNHEEFRKIFYDWLICIRYNMDRNTEKLNELKIRIMKQYENLKNKKN